jgi:hypothetical protein
MARSFFIAWAIPFVVWAQVVGGDITFTRDHVGGDGLTGGYVVSAPGYTVHLRADGCLYDWKSPSTTLVGSGPVGYDTKDGLRDIRRLDGRTIMATDGDRTAVYRFFPDRIGVRLRASPAGMEFFTEAPFRIHIPASGQAVADSYFGVWQALPTHQYWPNFDILYETGDSVRVFIGNDLPPPDLENFGLNGRVWTLRIPADAQWHSLDLFLKQAPGTRRVAAAPDFTISTPNPRRILFSGEPARFTITVAGGGVLADFPETRMHYRVLDYWGDEVLHGSQSVALRQGRDRVIDLNLPTDRRGWMLLQVTLDAQAADMEGIPRTLETNYAVCPKTPELARLEEERAIAEANGETYGWSWERTYFALGAKIQRVPFLVSMATNEPVEGEFDWEKSDKAMEQQHLASQQYGLTHFTQIEGAAPWAMDPRDDPDKRLPRPDKLDAYRAYCEALAKRYRKEMGVWEVFNEPDVYRITPEEYYERLLVPSWQGVKQGNPGALLIAGTTCGVKIPFYDRLYKLGAAGHADIWGFHPYCPGDWEEEGIGEFFDKFRALMKLHNDEKPLWITEVGYMFSDGHEPYWGSDRLPYGCQPPYGPLRNPRSEFITKSYLVAETRGIPREQYYYYYFPIHGFQPMYVFRRDGSLLPAGVAVLTLHDQLRGARFARTLPTPQRGVTAAVFEAEDRKVVAAWTFSFSLEVRFRTDAPKVRVVNMMGVSSELKPENGLFSLRLTRAPQYIALPKDAGIEEQSGSRWTANLALNARATASSNSETAGAVVDGLLNDFQRPLGQLRQPESLPGFAWQDGTPGEFPDWVELAFPAPTRLNKVIVYSHSYQTLRDYDLECMESGSGEWKVVASLRDNVVDWCHLHRFPTVEATRLRVKVLYANSGLMQSHPLLCGHKQATLIREVEAYLVEERQPESEETRKGLLSGSPGLFSGLAALLMLAGSLLAWFIWERHRR